MKAQDVSDELVIDVRTRPEYQAEHIPGSVHVPLHKVSSTQFPDRDIAVVCQTGRRASRACAHIPRAEPIEGGLVAWRNAGKKTAHGEEMWSMQRQVRFSAGSLVLVGSALAVLASPYWALLAGAVGAGLMYSGASDSCAMAWLLARLPHNSRSQEEIQSSL